MTTATPPTIRVVILDFDGVVLESNSIKTDAFADVFAHFPEHASAMMAFHHANISASRFVKFDHLLERLGRSGDQELRQRLAAEFSERSRQRVTNAPFVPGAEEFLLEFSPRVPLYLASVTPADDLSHILADRHLSRFFRVAYGCPPWTKIEAVRDALTREGLGPTEAVLIGDSSGDARAASAAGVQFVARDSGLAFETTPSVVFPDMIGVANYLRPRLQ